MDKLSVSPKVKHLVLLGGGHSHLAVLMHLAMKPLPGLQVTLVSRDIHTPYSGSLPGYISGFYKFDDIHIDLRPLAQYCGATLIRDEVRQVNLEKKLVYCTGRPPLEFDFLSLNIGSAPDVYGINGTEHAIAIKPIDRFIDHWQRILTDIKTRATADAPYTVAIVGGGPATVELAFSAQYRVHQELGIKNAESSPLRIQIISADDEVLASHSPKARRIAQSLLHQRDIAFHPGHRVLEFRPNAVICENGQEILADCIIYATGASMAQWPAKCGLKTTADGFIEVTDSLQSTSHEFVFAGGDVASIVGYPRPKSGVYAVRHGKPLAQNLVRFALGKKLTRYIPQKNALALISTGDKGAIASRGSLALHGRWVGTIKTWIDNGFVRKHNHLPPLQVDLALPTGLIRGEEEIALKKHALRCGGCGGKVPDATLTSVISTLPLYQRKNVIPATFETEDAAILMDGDHTIVQSVDYLRAFISDPWLFARIAANHCLGDIHAMGAEPHSAMAIVNLPFAGDKIMAQQLRELMTGCVDVLNDNETALIGGHTSESTELGMGLSINGCCTAGRLLRKKGLQVGDVLILTKPLGTGTLLAADMRRCAMGRWMEEALAVMQVSNRQAVSCLRENNASACTDITGFGLAGHLMEMIGTDGIQVELCLKDLPVMSGAMETLSRGIFSSLHQKNARHRANMYNAEAFNRYPAFELLFDPQTAGGLLAGIPAARVEPCLAALYKAGYADACVVGSVSAGSTGNGAVVLR
ncbi:MAG: selenide, water dikinase SelD [Pseudohongiellaceae bacterium]